EGALLHPEDDLDPVLGEARHVGVHLVEEAHRVDGADVAIDGFLVEGLARLGAQVDPDGVLLDAQVAGDPDARDRRLALRAERHLPGDQRQGSQQGDRPPPCVSCHGEPPHDVMPCARPRGPEPSSWSAPPARRSVRPIAAARRSLWVATTSAAPCSWLSSNMSCWTSSPVAGSRLPVGSSARRASERVNTSTPANRTRPPVGWSSAPRRWRSVDLPTPDSPTMASRSPASTSRSSPARTCTTAGPST